MFKGYRHFISWEYPRVLRQLCCKCNWHLWRYNSLYSGMPSGNWIRYCNDCGQYQTGVFIDAYKYKWVNWNRVTKTP